MIFDIAFLVFVGLGFYQGFRSGIIYSIFSLAGFFLGIIAALRFSYTMVHLLQGFVTLGPKTTAIVSFILVFILVVLVLRFIAWGLEQILKSFALNWPNKIIGGIIHSLIGLYVFCVFVWFFGRLDAIPESQQKQSHTYPYVINLAPQVVKISSNVIPMFKDTFEKFDTIFGTHVTR